MSRPLVSIVTPSFNQGPFIRQTIESILGQDYPNLEYIIVDGGSSDETAAVARDYSSRLTFISEKDKGQSHAINKGFHRSRGDFLAWVNSDDLLLAGAVSTAVEAFIGCPVAGAVYGDGYLMDSNGHLNRRFPHTRPFHLWRLVHVSDYILQPASFFRRPALDRVGYLDESLVYAMDWDLFIRIGKVFPLHYVPEYLGCLREHGEAKTSVGGRRRIAEIRRVLRAHSGDLVPPGWIVYGLETYAHLWSSRIERWVPQPLTTIRDGARLLVTRACFGLAGLIVSESQDWYSDGWAGGRLRYMLPAGEGRLQIEGSLPGSGWLKGQNIELVHDGAPVVRFRPKTGPFRFDHRLPCSGGRPLEIELRASHTTVPAYTDGRDDYRELAYKLDYIHWGGYSYSPPRQPT